MEDFKDFLNLLFDSYSKYRRIYFSFDMHSHRTVSSFKNEEDLIKFKKIYKQLFGKNDISDKDFLKKISGILKYFSRFHIDRLGEVVFDFEEFYNFYYNDKIEFKKDINFPIDIYKLCDDFEKINKINDNYMVNFNKCNVILRNLTYFTKHEWMEIKEDFPEFFKNIKNDNDMMNMCDDLLRLLYDGSEFYYKLGNKGKALLPDI